MVPTLLSVGPVAGTAGAAIDKPGKTSHRPKTVDHSQGGSVSTPLTLCEACGRKDIEIAGFMLKIEVRSGYEAILYLPVVLHGYLYNNCCSRCLCLRNGGDSTALRRQMLQHKVGRLEYEMARKLENGVNGSRA